MPRTVKVAVLGSGLAGLTAAYLLSRPRPRATDDEDVEFEVHLFEKAPTLGMDAYSISVPLHDRDTGEKAQPADSDAKAHSGGTSDATGTDADSHTAHLGAGSHGAGEGKGRGDREHEGEWRIDVPMRSFQGGYYPQLIALYTSLGVAFRQRDFSYSFSTLDPTPRPSITTQLIYDGGTGRGGISMPAIFRLSPAHTLLALLSARAAFALTLLLAVYHFLRLTLLALPTPLVRPQHLASMSFAQWAAYAAPTGRVARWTGMDRRWDEFVHDVLVPTFSAVCSAGREDVLGHPAEEFLDYVWLTFGTHHYVLAHGVRTVVARLTANLCRTRTHLGACVTALAPDARDPTLVTVQCAGGAVHQGFAHVVFATPAHAAAGVLQTYADALPQEDAVHTAVAAQLACLRRFARVAAVVVNHTDAALLPSAPGDVRDLNLISARAASAEKAKSDLCVPASYTMATHVLPRPRPAGGALQGPAQQVYQTTNPLVPPRAGTVLSAARIERALLTRDGKDALRGLCVDRPGEGSRRGWGCSAVAPTALGPCQGAGRLSSEAATSEPTLETTAESVRSPGIWFCGAYAHRGIPLLEGCVASARDVVEQGVMRCEGVEPLEPPW